MPRTSASWRHCWDSRLKRIPATTSATTAPRRLPALRPVPPGIHLLSGSASDPPCVGLRPLATHCTGSRLAREQAGRAGRDDELGTRDAITERTPGPRDGRGRWLRSACWSNPQIVITGWGCLHLLAPWGMRERRKTTTLLRIAGAESVALAVELFNRPSPTAWDCSVLRLLGHAFEHFMAGGRPGPSLSASPKSTHPVPAGWAGPSWGPSSSPPSSTTTATPRSRCCLVGSERSAGERGRRGGVGDLRTH